MKMEIGYFTPPSFEKRPFSIASLNEVLGKSFQYASKGRYCLYHILKSLDVKGPVLLPVYCCSTVLEPLRRLGLDYHYYDISVGDCNADVDSVKKLTNKYNPDCIIAVSMYGNPCCLVQLEQLCRERHIKLIDDAAQSIGAELNGRKVVTFGDAGFFSLSPGKPCAGHMGGFFWTSKEYSFNYKKRTLLHWLVYQDFYVNRLNGLKNNGRFMAKFLKRATALALHKTDICYDGFSRFENEIIGGILHDSITQHTPLRTELAIEINRRIKTNDLFYQILPHNSNGITGIAHKYIFVCKTADLANALLEFIKKRGIQGQKGYKMLTSDFRDLPNAKVLEGRIVEIPLDPTPEACQYIADSINIFINQTNTTND